MKRLSLLALAASALALSACASLAPYGPASGGESQGYVEQRIETGRYRVTYRGVGEAGPVNDYALRRAAELTLSEGYDWFEVTQRWIDGRPDAAGGLRPRVSIGAGTSRGGGFSSSGVGLGLGLDVSGPRPVSVALEVLMGRGERPARPEAYDARAVQAALGR